MSEELQVWKQRIEELMRRFQAGGREGDEAADEMFDMAGWSGWDPPTPQSPYIDFNFLLADGVALEGRADVCGNVIRCHLVSESNSLDVTSQTFADFCDHVLLDSLMEDVWEDVEPDYCAEFARMWWELKQELEQLKASQC